MPVPDDIKKAGMIDGANKRWDIIIGEYKLVLWAGAANGSRPQNCNLDYEDYTSFHGAMYKKGLRLGYYELQAEFPNEWMWLTHQFNRQEVDEIYDFLRQKVLSSQVKRIPANLVVSSSNGNAHIVERVDVCPECNGTKVIDTGFYKRACMRCYKE